MKKILLFSMFTIILSSCASMFQGVVFPDQCKKCEIVNLQTNEVLFVDEGCGSDNTYIERDAKIRAYELSREGFDLCDLEVQCTTWKQESDTIQ